ncbi:MAG: 3-hydroxybutyryl-CoA dehydratase [Deltaproteobacteria bacterium]|nr:3-hydroxybutyryl-CoA dehydratase [Deltaproteobacteria bacterium]
MTESLARYEIKDRIAVVTIDHPPMNALNMATREAIAAVFAELDEQRREIRAVALTGAGKAFAAGADIKTFLELEPVSSRSRSKRSHEILGIIENFEWPVIAALHGYCLGGGLELALACDIRYADPATKLGFPEVTLSVFPGNGGCCRTLKYVPIGRLKELVFSGVMICAEQALSYGLIEKVTEPGKVLDEALALAATIASRGPLAVAAAKKVINRARDLPLPQALGIEADFWAGLTATEDMKEGARAFIEKRKPQFQYR